MEQQLIYTASPASALDDLTQRLGRPRCVIIADVNTAGLVLPVLTAESETAAAAPQIIIKSGDADKNLNELTGVWRQMDSLRLGRKDIVINVGGGVVTDLGGFAAATFKRGLRCINMPTTVLAAVDASVGGKTGINFNGVKNLIGTFTEPLATIISGRFFATLPPREILSGYAEIIKHSLLEDDRTFTSLLHHSPAEPAFSTAGLLPLIQTSVLTKKRICDADLRESGIRKALNFGHTAGHAFEALALRRQAPVPHGYAVAWGMVTEIILSHMLLNFPSEYVALLARYVTDNYGAFDLSCNDYPELLELMSHDKKNTDPEKINFTLLEAVGRPRIDCTADPERIKVALDIYRDFSGQ